MSASIYRTSAGRTHLRDIYLRALEGLPATVTRRTIGTRFGGTHLLGAGSEGGPPVMLFQGGNSVHPLSLAWFLPLLRGIVAPVLDYMLRPSQRRLDRAVKPIFTGEPDPLWLEAAKASFDHLRLEPSMPRPATTEELVGFTAPTLVIAAERDPFFPGRLVLQRAREILPHARLELFEGESHVLSDDGVRRLREIVSEMHAPDAEVHA